MLDRCLSGVWFELLEIVVVYVVVGPLVVLDVGLWQQLGRVRRGRGFFCLAFQWQCPVCQCPVSVVVKSIKSQEFDLTHTCRTDR
jgi:hypothetical protein